MGRKPSRPSKPSSPPGWAGLAFVKTPSTVTAFYPVDEASIPLAVVARGLAIRCLVASSSTSGMVRLASFACAPTNQAPSPPTVWSAFLSDGTVTSTAMHVRL
jgi:hypothetical protein